MAIIPIKRTKGLVYKVVLPKKAGQKRLTRTCQTMSEAKLWEAKLKVQNTGCDPYVHIQNLSLKDVIDDWLKSNQSKWEPGTYDENKRRIYNLHQLFDIKLSKLTAFRIDEWISQAKRTTTQRRLGFQKEIKELKTCLNWYHEYRNPTYHHQILKRHLKDAVMKPRPQKLLESQLSYEKDIRAFVEAFKSLHNPLYYVLAATMYYTGMRIGEAAALDVHASIDFGRQSILVDRIIDWDHSTKHGTIKLQTKTKKARMILMPTPLIKLLRWWIENKRASLGTLVFHRNGNPLSYTAIQSAFYRAKRISGITIPGCTHFLRHAFATQFARTTGDTRATGCSLGHTQEQTTARYIHLDQENYQEKWERFNQNVPHLSLVQEG